MTNKVGFIVKLRLGHLLLAFLLAGLVPLSAQAEVEGSVAWSWADFSRKSDNSSLDVDASHFLQSYSLLYKTHNLINSGQAGEWDVALGYEWSSLDTSVNDHDAKINAGKFLYSGELLFAPGGLPIRLHAFSYDMNRTFPIDSAQGSLLEPRIYTDLGDAGQNIVTGVTLLAGIKNGSYLGQYREMLSQIPRLLIDYKQTYIRNTESLEQEHTRLRDLAFVSLNKKDNWFHYRVTDYEDFNDASNNFEDRVYMIGTVDHTLARQWINLTNWIQLSVDGSLEQVQEVNDHVEDTYSLNLFTKFNRRDWFLRNFTNYERTLETGGVRGQARRLNKYLEIPVFASGSLDPRNKWRMSLFHSSEEESYGATDQQPSWNEHLSYLNFQLESQRSSGLIVTSTAAMDLKRGSTDDEGQALRGELEVRTDRRRDLETAWLLKYAATAFNGKATGDYYFEQEINASVDHQLSPALRLGGSQHLTVGLGKYQAYSTEYLKPVLAGTVDFNNFSDSDITDNSWRSQTELYLEMKGNSRWKQRFVSKFDYMDRAGETSYNFLVEHVADYRSNQFFVNMDSRYESGDQVDLVIDSDTLDGLAVLVGLVDQSFMHLTTVEYAPARYWQTGAKMGISWGEGDKGSAALLKVEQNSSYSLFAAGGKRNRLMLIEQKADYECLFGDVEGSPWYAELKLASTWYPYRFLTLGARAEFRHYSEGNANVVEYGLNATIPFEKFLVDVSYEYGQADEGWERERNPGVTEHRWGVDVKKTF